MVDGETSPAIIIHPKCPIDENAKRARSWDWLIPPRPPIRVLIIAAADIKNTDSHLVINIVRIIRGASFCHVEIIMHWVHEMPAITAGNHQWVGAAPSFIRILEITTKDVRGFMDSVISGVYNIDVESNSTALPIVCTKKYLIADSVS